MGENKRKHLEFIHSTIGRMNDNSRNIKTWCVTLLAALGAVFSVKQSVIIVFVACMVVGFCWALYAYYLQMERRFRNLYHYVAKKREEDIDFSMKEWKCPSQYRYAFLSKSERMFYLPLFVLLLLIGAGLLLAKIYGISIDI